MGANEKDKKNQQNKEAEMNINNNVNDNIVIDNDFDAPDANGEARETVSVPRSSSRASAAPIVENEAVEDNSNQDNNAQDDNNQDDSQQTEEEKIANLYNDIQNSIGSDTRMTADNVKAIKESFDKDMSKFTDAKEKQKECSNTLNKESEEFYKKETEKIGAAKNQGKEVNISETTKAFDVYRKQLFDYCKNGHSELKDMQYPAFGGVELDKMRGMQKEAYSQLPKELQTKEELNQIEDFPGADYIRENLQPNNIEINPKENSIKVEEKKEELPEEKQKEVKQEEQQKEESKIENQPKETPKVENQQNVKQQVKQKAPNPYESMVKDASARMAKEFNNLQKSVGSFERADANSLSEDKKQLDAKMKALPPENRKEAFLNEFKKYSAQYFKDAIGDIASAKQQGKNINIVGGTMAHDAYMKKSFEFYKMGHPELDGLEYPQFGGQRAADIKSMQLKAFSSVPTNNQSQRERKQINDYYAKNVIGQRKLESKTFSTFLNAYNKSEKTNFKAQGIEKYFQGKWQQLGNKPLAEKQALFQQEVKYFAERSFQNVNKNLETTDYAKQVQNFDKYTFALQELCKSKGYLDANKPNAYLGGLNPGQIKAMQLAGLERKPKNIENKAIENIKDITGFEPAKNNAYQQKFGDSYSVLATEPRIKNFNKSINEILSKVPNSDDKTGGANNRYFVEAAKTAYALDTINNSRSKTWIFFHRKEHKAYTDGVKQIVDTLKNKNYKQESIIEQGKAKPNATNDAVYGAFQKQKEQINDLYFDVSNKYNQRVNSQINDDLNADRERINVNEANLNKEVTNAKETSPFIKTPAAEKNNEVEMSNTAVSNTPVN